MQRKHLEARQVLPWAFMVVLVVAAGLRLRQIYSVPPGFHFDEYFEGLEAWSILTEPAYKPVFLTGNFGVAPLNSAANALTFGLFDLLGGEAGPTAMRVTAAVFGILGVLVVFALGRELAAMEPRLSPLFPVLAAAALAVMRWHIHYSRMGIEPILVPLEWAASSWLLARGWRTGSWWNFAGCGVVMAACFYSYQGAWIVPFLVLLWAIHLALTGRSTFRRRWHGLLLAGGLAVVLALPLGWFFLHNPDLLVLRPSQIAITSGETQASAGFWQNLWATARMVVPFGQGGDLDPRRNLPGAPALSLWLAVPFFIGLLMAVAHLRRPAYSLPLIGLAGLILPGLISDYAPHFHRILGATAPIALLIALPLDWLLEAGSQWSRETQGWVSRFPQRSASLIPLLVLLLFVAAGFSAARDYFVRWAALPDLYYAFDTGLWDLGRWIARQPASIPVYLTPRDASHPTLAFAWRPGSEASHGAPASFDGRTILPFTDGVSSHPEAYAVVEHEDFRTRLLLPEVLPEASVVTDFVDAEGGLYARVYGRPAGTAPQYQPQVPLDLALGDGIRLAGYDVIPDAPRPGDGLILRLHWSVDAVPTADWTVFTHLFGPSPAGDSMVLAGHDSQPGSGSLPTSRWQPGWRIIDEYSILLPEDLPPGHYGLEAGLYQASGARLPAGDAGVMLGTVEVSPPS
jgi:hypothetical protein